MKQQKHIPQSRVVATPLRVVIILQLSLAFTLLAFYAGYPFMGELYEIKAAEHLADQASGKYEESARTLFSQLPPQEKEKIVSAYASLAAIKSRPFLEKIQDACYLLIKAAPPFEKAWLFFSVLISLLILLRSEGAKTASWILPLIVFAYGLDALLSSHKLPASGDAAIFPSEKFIIDHYLQEPLKGSLSEQQHQLRRAFNRYLAAEWSQEPLAREPHQLERQARQGLYYFTAARLNAHIQQLQSPLQEKFLPRANPLLFLLYFIWNTFFAWLANRSKTPSKDALAANFGR